MAALVARPELLAAARQRCGLARDVPILFSAPMIEALLAGRKTQTRRILKPQPVETPGMNCRRLTFFHRSGRERGNTWIGDTSIDVFTPFHIGDRLWVRETCWILGRWYRNGKTKSGRAKWRFKEDSSRQVRFEAPVPTPIKRTVTQFWRRNSIHMPRWASRLTLPVTDVRVQQLHDIGFHDVMDEGVIWSEKARGFVVPGVAHPDKAFPVLSRVSAREMYAALWDVINGSGAWLANPWIVAATFNVQHRNIDA